jgi:hypothetical protein
MSRDEIVITLQSYGAFSLLDALEAVESGRLRHVLVDPIPGDPAFSREVVEFLRSLGAEVEFNLPASRARLRHVG